ncbi:MAG: hypothetical protein R6V67_10735 [Spirochaetia bacterium]
MEEKEKMNKQEPANDFETEQDQDMGHHSESSSFYVLYCIDEIRGIFRNHFESGWFLIVLERMAFNTVYLNDIRRLTELQSIYPSDFYHIRTGTIAMEEFIQFSRRYLLPVLRDQLGISGFTRWSIPHQDRTTLVVKEFFASAFPYNLERLAELTEQLNRSAHRMAVEEGLIRQAESSASTESPAAESMSTVFL